MDIQDPESPYPPDEPAPGYFAPPTNVIVGNEWRLIQSLRDLAASRNATTILTAATVEQCRHLLTPSPGRLGMAMADLAVTGRVAFDDFAALKPQDGGPIAAAALATLTTAKVVGATAALVATAFSQVLDRAYQVAWFLRGQTSRGNLKWIAVSGEDDLPHRPVNVPATMYPQGDLTFTVPLGSGSAIPVRTRYAIATAVDPVPTPVSLPQRSLPPVFLPTIPPDDRIILFIHGSDSRLEEANDVIPKLVRKPDGSPSGITVISMDLPGSGYVNQIGHTEIGPWPTTVGPIPITLLPFLERFLVAFVGALSSAMGQAGFVESRVAAFLGGSLGGNLALRLARRSEPWIRRVVAYSPGSVWDNVTTADDPVSQENAALILAGIGAKASAVMQAETPTSRDDFFAGAFDQKIPLKTQPEQWFRDGWPSKAQYITNARLDRREIYTPQYRAWHWRVSLEELAWSWQDPAVQQFRARVLLGAGSEDDIKPAFIFSNARKLAARLGGTKGDSFFFAQTGHAIHAERPDALARKVVAFLDDGLESSWANLGAPPNVNLQNVLGVVTAMDTATAPQRPHAFIAGDDQRVWCSWYSGSVWNWSDMGKAPGGNILGAAGTVTVMDTPTSMQRPHLFVQCVDGNIWCLRPVGSTWGWVSLGKPPTANIRARFGAVTIMDTPSAPQRPHVFVECDNDHLWCLWYDGIGKWTWSDMGKPANASILGGVGAVSIVDPPLSPQRAHLFVAASDGQIHCCRPAGGQWGWVPLGKPAGANIRGLLSAVTAMDMPTSPQRPHVFVECNDDQLWCLWYDGIGKWTWSPMGKPSTAKILGGVAAVSVMDTPTAPQRPHLFVAGNDGNIWCRWSSGSDWSWLDVSRPPRVSIISRLGAVTVMDTPTSPQRAHVFVLGSDGNLWVDWWG